MEVAFHIQEYINTLPELKAKSVNQLHDLVLSLFPDAKLWFFDGKNDQGKVIANTTIGYGNYVLHYANGSSRKIFKMGMGVNSSGVFLHFLIIKDKSLLSEKYGHLLGKVVIRGYGVTFKNLEFVNLNILLDMIIFVMNKEE